MALIPCPDCGGQVSDRAAVCPHCGGPLAPPSGAQWLGELLRARRQALGLSLAAAAQRAGVAPSTVLRYEQGRFARLNPVVVRRLSQALALPEEELAGVIPSGR